MTKTITLFTLGVFVFAGALAGSNEPVKGSRPGTPAQQTSTASAASTQLRNNSIIIFEDNMDQYNDTASLHQRGYITAYNSLTAQGSAPTFFNGSGTIFPSYNGHDSSYVASNFQTVSGTADIDNWLILPAMNINMGDSLVFFARAPIPGPTEYVDSMRVMYSHTGFPDIYVPEWVELGRFKVRNDGEWGRMGFMAPASGSTARFAIRYAVANGGPTGANSNFVGIDQITVSSVSITGLSANADAISMTMYPNPATESLFVQSVVAQGTITITNALGQQVLRQAVAGTSTKLNLSNMASGVYSVSIQSEKGIATQKFVKR